MGKSEEDQALPSNVASEASAQNAEAHCAGCCGGFRRFIGLRCILVLLLSVALFLSAMFWLPPFLQFADQSDLDLDSKFKDHYIVANFNLLKPVSLLEDNILQLENDIFDEIVAPSIKVVIVSVESLTGSNVTTVVFGVDPEPKSSKLLATSQSLIKASFEYLVTHQSLRLNTSLFGRTSLFEVLKFPGGITIVPPQNAFLLQKVQILFNFTLNFSIYQIQVNFNKLKSQLKAGLHLAPYENLYISLSNSRGSTVAAPTTVQASVFLTVGNTPSMQRLKQLAQTIRGSHSRNLGLNNTVFGRVKQVRLSSIYSLNGGDGTAPSPSPAPLPHPHHHHHHHHHHRHHHHHHHHHHNPHLAPTVSPAPSTDSGPPASQKGGPAPKDGSPDAQKGSPPGKSCEAKPPSFQFGSRGKTGKESHFAPAVAPNIFPPVFIPSPQKQVQPSPPIYHSVPVSSPLPHLVFAHVQPPSKSESDKRHSDTMSSAEPSPSTSSAALIPSVQWAFSLFLVLVLHV